MVWCTMRFIAAINCALMLRGGGQPRKRDVVFREEVDAASSALEHADYPLAVLSQASRGLDHRATAVGAGGGFWHGGG